MNRRHVCDLKERQQHCGGCRAVSIHPWLQHGTKHGCLGTRGSHGSHVPSTARCQISTTLFQEGEDYIASYLLASFIFFFFAWTKAKLVKWVSYLLKELYLFTRLGM